MCLEILACWNRWKNAWVCAYAGAHAPVSEPCMCSTYGVVAGGDDMRQEKEKKKNLSKISFFFFFLVLLC